MLIIKLQFPLRRKHLPYAKQHYSNMLTYYYYIYIFRTRVKPSSSLSYGTQIFALSSYLHINIASKYPLPVTLSRTGRHTRFAQDLCNRIAPHRILRAPNMCAQLIGINRVRCVRRIQIGSLHSTRAAHTRSDFQYM